MYIRGFDYLTFCPAYLRYLSSCQTPLLSLVSTARYYCLGHGITSSQVVARRKNLGKFEKELLLIIIHSLHDPLANPAPAGDLFLYALSRHTTDNKGGY